jgi:hypothetical protein
MRKALIVGIDDYPDSPLGGCVNDANTIAEALKRNGDGSPNFDVELITSPGTDITRAKLREMIDKLFKGENEMALLFFAGHGAINNSGGFLMSRDGKPYDEGVSMDEILNFANNSPARNKVIMLDCCHSGALGNPVLNGSAMAHLSEGLTVLSASRDSEYAMEKGGSGIFTTLVNEALMGGAADIIGNVTPGALYTYVDQALGPWDQRPIFKSNVEQFTTLRTIPPKIPLETLRKIAMHFPERDNEFALDPSYEYSHKDNKEENVKVFKELQQFEKVGLVVPVGEEYMYHAAVNSKACKLTAVGYQYWRLAKEGKI